MTLSIFRLRFFLAMGIYRHSYMAKPMLRVAQESADNRLKVYLIIYMTLSIFRLRFFLVMDIQRLKDTAEPMSRLPEISCVSQITLYESYMTLGTFRIPLFSG